MRRFMGGVLLVAALAAQPKEIATLETPASPGWFVMAKTGRLVGAVCGDEKLRLWTLPEGRITRTIGLSGRSIDSITISEDGGLIAAGDHNGAYTVWNTATGAEQMNVQMMFYPSALAFSADGTRLAIAPMGEPVRIYDPASGKKLFELQRTIGGSGAVVFSRDGSRIATADSDTAVRIYDARNGEMLARNEDFVLEPFTAAFAADGRQLLAAGADKIIASLDAVTGKTLRKSDKAADPILYMEISPDGAFVVAVLIHADNINRPGRVVISEIDSGRNVQEWLPANPALGGGWTSDGHLLAATGSAKALHIWRLR